METKKCTKCSEVFPASIQYFSKLKTGRLGLNSRCKNCLNELSRLYRKENPERVKASKVKLMNNNRDKYNENNRNRYINDEVFRAKKKEALLRYRTSNTYKYKYTYVRKNISEAYRQAQRARNKKYRDSNKEKIKIKSKNYYIKNRDRLIIRSKEVKIKLEPSHVAYLLRKKVCEVPDDVMETKRLTVMLKRELGIGKGIVRK